MLSVTWRDDGFSEGCDEAIHIGVASSLDDAKTLMLNDKRCRKERASLFYSGYSYDSSWGVRCMTEGYKKGCTPNWNWRVYVLSFNGFKDGECLNSLFHLSIVIIQLYSPICLALG